MEITIDLTQLTLFSNKGLSSIVWAFFSHGGWLILVILILATSYINWLNRKRLNFVNNTEHTLLAIDIPKDNEQSLVAVEQIFAHLTGISSNPNLIEKFIYGEVALWLSLEIISLEGYIQFLIRTPIKFKDLVEAAVYAQYPEAEITEVEDYVDMIPEDVHELNSDFNIWGTEFKLKKDSCYPIKIYRNFEDALIKTFNDPMAALLETMSKLSKGEQLGLQILIKPVSDDWKDQGNRIIKKLIGEKIDATDHLGDKLVSSSMKALERMSESVISLWSEIEEERPQKDAKNSMQYLTSGEKNIIEGIERKLSQLSFATKFRVYYLAHTEVFQKGKGVNSIIGAINQFNTTDLNAFKKAKNIETNVEYFFKKRRISIRQRKFVKNYKSRSFTMGSSPFMLSIEELATLYHFPIITVKTPLLKKVEAKKGGPPTSLPTEIVQGKEYFKQPIVSTNEEPEETVSTEINNDKQVKKPDHLITESLPGYDFDNDYYEKKFSKNNSQSSKESQTKEIKKVSAEPPDNLPFIRS